MSAFSVWDAQLLEFCHSLKPSQEYIKSGNEAVETVVKILSKKQCNYEKKYKIDRHCMAGSIGKHTSLELSDFDCVLFINDEKPPHTAIISRFESILKQYRDNKIYDGLDMTISEIKKTRFSLQFKLEYGQFQFEVDLLVAGNNVPNDGEGLGKGAKALVQKTETWAEIRKNPSDYYLHSSALAESQIKFMKTQDSFTHSLVRLCKYWLKSLDLGPYRAGVKLAIELIAVWVAQSKFVQREQSIRVGFWVFLDQVKTFDSLKIAFRPSGEYYRQLTRKLGRPNSVICRQVPEEIRQKRYFIIDPANPYNDLSENVTCEVLAELKECAHLTRKKFSLKNYRRISAASPEKPDFNSLLSV